MRKKIILKSIIFIFIFAFITASLTGILKYKSREKLYESKKQVMSMPKNSIDVLFLGASAIYADISPVNLWIEHGITSFNLASSVQPPLITYYTLIDAMRRQKPELIVVDFASLTVQNVPDSTEYEGYYLRGLDGILDVRLKVAAVNEMDREFGIPSKLSYLVQFFRFHHRWSALEEKDFVDMNKYEPYTLGGLLSDKVASVDFDDIVIDQKENEAEVFAPSQKYYLELINLAKEQGIGILSISPPRVKRDDVRNTMIEAFCEENGVRHINFNREQSFRRLDLDLDRDFYDHSHLNKYGNRKFTMHIGQYISDHYTIEDKRNLEGYAHWDELYEAYIEANGI